MKRFLMGKTGFILGFIACFAIVGLALVIQTRYGLEPCPLCISQRIVLMSLGLLFLIGAYIPPQSVFKKLWLLVQVLTTAGGASIAIRHWYLQANRENIVADCGVGFNYMFENFPLQKAFKLLFRGTGDCAAIDWTFLGLSLPQLALITFVCMAIYAVFLVKKNH